MGIARSQGWRLAVVALWVPIATVSAQTSERYDRADLKALEEAFVRLAADVQPSVVAVRTYRAYPPDEEGEARIRIPLSQGTGFVIDSTGFIATNRHVIAGADLIAVRLLDGTVHNARLIRDDPRSDLAVLRIEQENLPVVRWGDLSKVRVNQWAFSCGNPFGRANLDGRPSVTMGVVSALGRQMTRRLVGNSDVEYYGNLIETSAPINPGNSGGPLFNLDGEVIGVITAIETTTGVGEGHGFAIPIDKNTRRILATLKSGQPVRYGFLGVEVQEVEPDPTGRVVSTRPNLGAVIREIKIPNGPAARAGLKPRDVVIEYDGVPVDNHDHLVRLVGFTPVGSDVVVTILRNGVRQRTTVTIGDRADLLGLDP
jgi:serine protease Do